MEAELVEEEELLEYECSDGSQVIIATSEEVLSAAGLTAFRHGGQVLEYLHEGEDEHGNIILSARNFSAAGSEPEDNDEDENEAQVQDSIIVKLEGHQQQQAVVERSSGSGPASSSSSSKTCTECGAQFASKKALRLHSTVHVDEADYACEFCPATKIHWTELWMHQCANLDSVPIICPQCHVKVSTKKQLQIHEEVHELQRRFKAKSMNGYFKKKLEAAEDPRVDWGAKPFICGVCGRPFGKLYELEYHEKLHTGARESGNNCEKCGLSYINRHDLNKHLAMGCTGQVSRKTDAPFRRSSVTASNSSGEVVVVSQS